MSNVYKQDGVNLELTDDLSTIASTFVRESKNNSPFGSVSLGGETFRLGVEFYPNDGALPDGWGVTSKTDGTGTKAIISIEAEDYQWLGHDLLAMTVGDLTASGYLPIGVTNDLSINTSDGNVEDIVKLYEGFADAAQRSRVVILDGETAELGPCVASENPNAALAVVWSGTAIGITHPDKRITGESLQVGDEIVLFEEDGFRSNGLSSVRAAFRKRYGNDWWSNLAARENLRLAAKPSTLYDWFLVNAHGWCAPNFRPLIPMKRVVHITGGGLSSRLGNDTLFPKGLSAVIDNPCACPEIVRRCAEWRGMGDRDVLSIWGAGQGLGVIVPKGAGEELVALAHEYGLAARVGGRVVSDPEPRISIVSSLSGQAVEFLKD